MNIYMTFKEFLLSNIISNSRIYNTSCQEITKKSSVQNKLLFKITCTKKTLVYSLSYFPFFASMIIALHDIFMSSQPSDFVYNIWAFDYHDTMALIKNCQVLCFMETNEMQEILWNLSNTSHPTIPLAQSQLQNVRFCTYQWTISIQPLRLREKKKWKIGRKQRHLHNICLQIAVECRESWKCRKARSLQPALWVSSAIADRDWGNTIRCCYRDSEGRRHGGDEKRGEI